MSPMLSQLNGKLILAMFTVNFY